MKKIMREHKPLQSDPFAKIDPCNPRPIHEQLKNCIIHSVINGELQPGDKLPSVEQLSRDKGCGLDITRRVYHELGLLGVLSKFRGIGHFVTDDAPLLCHEIIYTNIIKMLHQVVQEAKASGIEDSAVVGIVEGVFEEKG